MTSGDGLAVRMVHGFRLKVSVEQVNNRWVIRAWIKRAEVSS
jgi:hypothetical protein